jgi:Tfp pilus assembly protein FimT
MTHLLVVLAIVALFTAIAAAVVWGIVRISRRRGRTVDAPDSRY